VTQASGRNKMRAGERQSCGEA